MLVTETKMFTSPVTSVTITNMEGSHWTIEAAPDLPIGQLKMMAVSHFYSSSEANKPSMYKIVHVPSNKVLHDEDSVLSDKLQTNDDLLLIRRRTIAPSAYREDRHHGGEKKRPSQEQINKVTANIPSCNEERPLPEPTSILDFQAELRKILISLIDAAQKILCLSPKASDILREAEEMLDAKSAHIPKVDTEALAQLKEMGFSEARSKKALILNKMSPMAAMEWLLQHESDADIDTPLPGMEEESSPSTSPSPEGSGKKVQDILESFRAYKRRSFNPNPTALRKLIEMGFEEKDVRDALRVNGNNQDLACEWLLDPGAKSVSRDDADQGLDTDGPIYKAIMESPVVQLGLNNPRSLLAFLDMIENPASTNRWLNDPETGAMLIQISRIYHAEKHAIQSPAEAEKRSDHTSPAVHTREEGVTLSDISDVTSSVSSISINSDNNETADSSTADTIQRSSHDNTASVGSDIQHQQ